MTATLPSFVTHSGTFHCDDAFAYAVLCAALGVSAPGHDHTLTRTRDPAVIATADYVWDVGAAYDAAAGRFDHHQRGAPRREDGLPLSTAGLVWRTHGEAAVRALLPPDATPLAAAIATVIDAEVVRRIDSVRARLAGLLPESLGEWGGPGVRETGPRPFLRLPPAHEPLKAPGTMPHRGIMNKAGTPAYPGGSKSRVSKAGAAVRDGVETPEDLEVINAWRAAHKPVLNTFQSILRNRTRGTGTVVAQRHKRKQTIFDKLRRFPNMELHRMDDVAGCRLIFPDVASLREFRAVLHKARFRHKRRNDVDKYDYIMHPNSPLTKSAWVDSLSS